MTHHDQQPAQTIDQVLDALDGIIAQALRDGSRLGYFAVLYRKVTAKVRDGIAAGFFDDGERMQRLDVAFANRYLVALSQFEQNRRPPRPTRCWELAFEAAARRSPIVLQHLLVGINAHINLDLGVAAAVAAPSQALPALRRDFDRVNEILASLVRQVQRDIGAVSPWIALLDRIGGRSDEEVARFSIEVARTEAWRFATELAPLDVAAWSGPIGARDAQVSLLTQTILHPGLLRAGLLLIRSRESNDVRRIIEVLDRVEPPSLQAVEARVRQARATGD
ncbi:MAG TPA: DUF5995 family protein [Egibacteraceae bacterium]|nr:DUF5995 family protein [Actinomycetota bacterium]HWB72734.1 DUF5995 family protein [Egibacteraceae bacterium]